MEFILIAGIIYIFINKKINSSSNSKTEIEKNNQKTDPVKTLSETNILKDLNPIIEPVSNILKDTLNDNIVNPLNDVKNNIKADISDNIKSNLSSSLGNVSGGAVAALGSVGVGAAIVASSIFISGVSNLGIYVDGFGKVSDEYLQFIKDFALKFSLRIANAQGYTWITPEFWDWFDENQSRNPYLKILAEMASNHQGDANGLRRIIEQGPTDQWVSQWRECILMYLRKPYGEIDMIMAELEKRVVARYGGNTDLFDPDRFVKDFALKVTLSAANRQGYSWITPEFWDWFIDNQSKNPYMRAMSDLTANHQGSAQGLRRIIEQGANSIYETAPQWRECILMYLRKPYGEIDMIMAEIEKLVRTKSW